MKELRQNKQETEYGISICQWILLNIIILIITGGLIYLTCEVIGL